MKRLCDCLDKSFNADGKKSGPETWMFHAYYEVKNKLGIDVPALIPQVHQYYDPQTQKNVGINCLNTKRWIILCFFHIVTVWLLQLMVSSIKRMGIGHRQNSTVKWLGHIGR